MANVYDSIPTTGKTDTGNIYDSIPTTKKTGSRQYEGFEAPVAAVKNFVPSLQKFAGGVAEAIVHPVQSAKMLGKLVGGAALHALLPEEQKVVSAVIDKINRNPGLAQRMMDTAGQVGGLYKERYGTPEAIERTFAEDPFGFAADASTLLTGGAGLIRAGTAATAGALGGAGVVVNAVTKGTRGGKIAAAGTKVADTGAKVADKVSKSKLVAKGAQVLNPLEINVAAGELIRKGGNALAKAGAPKGVSNVVGAAGHVAEWLGPKKYADLAAEGVAGAVGAGMNALNPKAKAWLEATEGKGQAVIDRTEAGILKEADIQQFAEKHHLEPEDINKIYHQLSGTVDEQFTVTNQILEDLGRKNNQWVPGNLPSIAEVVAEDLQLTKLSKFDKTAREHLSTPSKRQQTANERADLADLRKVAKTDDHFEKVKEIGDDVAKVIYEDPHNAIVKADDELSAILETDAAMKALPIARAIASNERRKFRFAEDADDGVSYSGESLHDLKMGLDAMTSDPATYGIGAKHAVSINKVKHDLVKWMNENVPGFEAAQLKYQEVRRPLDRMKIGKELEKELIPPHGEGARDLNRTAFDKAASDPATTIEKATGVPNVKNFAKFLEPEEVKIIDRLKDNYRRQEFNKRLAKGSKGDPNLKKMATDAVGDATGPNFLNPVATIFRGIVGTLKGRMDRKLAEKVAFDLIETDLNVPVEEIKKALAHEAKVRQTKTKIEKRGKAVGNALRTPAVYNMLAPQAEPSNALAERQ